MKVPSIEQIDALVASMPIETAIDRRNRAIVALITITITITGARDDGIASLRIGGLDLEDR